MSFVPETYLSIYLYLPNYRAKRARGGTLLRGSASGRRRHRGARLTMAATAAAALAAAAAAAAAATAVPPPHQHHHHHHCIHDTLSKRTVVSPQRPSRRRLETWNPKPKPKPKPET